MPWTPKDPRQPVLHGPTVWRALIVFAAILASVAITSSAVLYNRTSNAIDANAALACRIGAFFVGTPVIRQPGQSKAVFRDELRKATSFLRALRSADCSSVKGAHITRAQINRQIRHFHHASRPSPPPNRRVNPPSHPASTAATNAAPASSAAAPQTTPSGGGGAPSPSGTAHNHGGGSSAPGGGGSPSPPPIPPPKPVPPPKPPSPGVNICVRDPLLPACIHAPSVTGPGGVLPNL